jgi:hypothetical protein
MMPYPYAGPLREGGQTGELRSECTAANIDSQLRNWYNKQQNELKPIVFYLHDPPTQVGGGS